MTTRRVTLNRALLAAIAVAVLAGMVPAGIVLDRRLATSLVERARVDLEMAPRLLADRNAAWSDALMMRAKDLSHAPGLAEAVARGDRPAMLAALESARRSLGASAPLVATPDSALQVGVRPREPLIALTRRGEMPVALFEDDGGIRNVALAPLEYGGRWLGAAGVTVPLDDEVVIGLKGLSRSDIILAAQGGTAVRATTLDSTVAAAILAASRAGPSAARSRELAVAGARYLVVSAPLGATGMVTFVRSVAGELQVLPALRHTAMLAAGGAVALALVLGAWLARRISRPVQQLAAAAQGVSAGTFDAALPDSRLAEVATVAERFGEMREVLRARLVELRESNEALQERSARLVALQGDLMQRERLAAAGRLVAQLAHEIRNPVASLRNCLEVVRRRVAHDPEGVEFADLAINELLRMHELAEQMLDVSRPRAHAAARSSPALVARDVVRLVTAGVPADRFTVTVRGAPHHSAAIAPDALKQVLLNLIQNAREAFVARRAGDGCRVEIDVSAAESGILLTIDDNGPGIPEPMRDRIFDPFFSTKTDMQGVGLGLFVAEGLVRSAGGRISVGEAPGGGAQFVIALPPAAAAPAPGATEASPPESGSVP